MTELKTLTVYSRRGCHLCEDLLGELEPLLRGRARLLVVDIDGSNELQDKYGQRVPVVSGSGRDLCQYHLDRQGILAWLAED